MGAPPSNWIPFVLEEMLVDWNYFELFLTSRLRFLNCGVRQTLDHVLPWLVFGLHAFSFILNEFMRVAVCMIKYCAFVIARTTIETRTSQAI